MKQKTYSNGEGTLIFTGLLLLVFSVQLYVGVDSKIFRFNPTNTAVISYFIAPLSHSSWIHLLHNAVLILLFGVIVEYYVKLTILKTVLLYLLFSWASYGPIFIMYHFKSVSAIGSSGVTYFVVPLGILFILTEHTQTNFSTLLLVIWTGLVVLETIKILFNFTIGSPSLVAAGLHIYLFTILLLVTLLTKRTNYSILTSNTRLKVQ